VQATNASKFGDINDTLKRLDNHILANDNHLFTTNAHQLATDKNLANLKRDIDKRFDDVTARLEDSQVTQATLTARMEQLMSSFDNFACQRHRSSSRSSRSSSCSNHVDDHARP
jgi:hypothetical protein